MFLSYTFAPFSRWTRPLNFCHLSVGLPRIEQPALGGGNAHPSNGGYHVGKKNGYNLIHNLMFALLVVIIYGQRPTLSAAMSTKGLNCQPIA